MLETTIYIGFSVQEIEELSIKHLENKTKAMTIFSGKQWCHVMLYQYNLAMHYIEHKTF